MKQEPLKDNTGNLINAHGAGILFHKNMYFLYGEIKKGNTTMVPGQGWDNYRVPASGLSCYVSHDLLNWTYKGVALAANHNEPLHELHVSKVIERPKVLFNRKTNRFVMWMHIDTEDYSLAHAGVAISEQPTGPFQYIGSIRPNGNMSRDMTVFKDDDETAYLVYSSGNNETVRICKLSDDYLSPTGEEKQLFVNQGREAPVMFKNDATYFIISSGCTGWAPNAAQYASASDPLGPWTVHGNPCQGDSASTTFNSQGTFVFPSPKKPGEFIFMADQWCPADLEKSAYLWLPLRVTAGKLTITWSDKIVL